MYNLKDYTKKIEISYLGVVLHINECPSNISMHCDIMICAHSNIVTLYDVTMDIPSNIITYCDAIMGHGTNM